MPPKKTKRTPELGGGLLQQKEILQAFVVADSFNIRFDPITSNLPRCLIPLANVPLLHYILTQIIKSGFDEIIVYCHTHADMIRRFIDTMHYPSVSIKVLVGEGACNLGDAFRDLENSELTRDDFIMVFGDLVTNVDLLKLLTNHKERRKATAGAIMTIVLKQTAKSVDNNVAVLLRPADNKLLNFINPDAVRKTKSFEWDMDQFRDGEKEIRCDLVDPHIIVCSNHIPALFHDNFDYANIEAAVNGIINNEEIMQNTVHVDIVSSGYVARATDMQRYMEITWDVLDRRVAPLFPPSLVGIGPAGFSNSSSTTVYTANSAVIERSSKLSSRVIIGAGSIVGSNCLLENCCVGLNCRIGDNTVVKNSVLLDRVVIGARCRVETSFLCCSVTLLDDVQLREKSVMSFDVTVGPGVTLEPGSVLVRVRPGDQLPSTVVGEGGRASRYQPRMKRCNSNADDSDEEDLGGPDYLPIWPDEHPTLTKEMKVEEEKEESESEKEEEEEEDDSETKFAAELRHTLRRGAEEGIQLDNLVLEINSLKLTHNVTIEDLYFILSKEVVKFHLSSDGEVTSARFLEGFKQAINDFSPVLKYYLTSVDSRKLCLQAVEDCACYHPVVLASCIKILYHLYNEDIVGEDEIFWWNTNSPLLADEDLTEKTKLIRKNVASFIDWLTNAEEEDSSS